MPTDNVLQASPWLATNGAIDKLQALARDQQQNAFWQNCDDTEMPSNVVTLAQVASDHRDMD